MGPEAAALSEGHMKATSPANKMFAAVEKGLGYQYQASWKLVLQVLEAFFDVSLVSHVSFSRVARLYHRPLSRLVPQ